MKILFSLMVLGLLSGLIASCGEEDHIYCCSYESRHSACGGGNYTSWETTDYQFDIWDYKEGWTPEDVCNKFTGSDTECGGSCCIYVEYQNNQLSAGECPNS
jgi:hypothetical protein